MIYFHFHCHWNQSLQHLPGQVGNILVLQSDGQATGAKIPQNSG